MTTRTGIREPAVAGEFYPAAPAELGRVVHHLLESVPAGTNPNPTPKALIAPHAGYGCSGPIAASAFRCVAHPQVIQRVVLLGPSHYCEFEGLALPLASAFATPLGNVPVDGAAVAELRAVPQVCFSDRAHEAEHCLEVELPFLQQTLGSFGIVPLLTGETSDGEVAEVIELLWDGPETLLVISSDLSHFLPYEAAQEVDHQTAKAIERLQAEAVSPEHACGNTAIRGLLTAARRRGLRARTVDLRNSGDTAGRRDRVVGYGAFALW